MRLFCVVPFPSSAHSYRLCATDVAVEPAAGGRTKLPLGRMARQPVPIHLEDLNLGTLALTNDFHPSERSDPLFSVGKWTKDCQLACENSTLHAFVNGRRNGANKSFCLGVVLVEPPATRNIDPAVPHSRATQPYRSAHWPLTVLPASGRNAPGIW